MMGSGSLLPSQRQVDPQMQTQKPFLQESESESVATLLVRHLPEGIPHDTLSHLFSHYGASSVRPCVGGRLRFLGKVLSVERASKPAPNNKNQQSEAQFSKDSSCLPASLIEDAPLTGNLTKGGNPGLPPAGEPIAARLGVDYPFPPHLEYAYPPPDGNILTNIVNALIAVPRFYTQGVDDGKSYSVRAPRVTNRGRKRAKQEAIVGPAVDKDVAHEAVGLKPVNLVPKEIPMIKKKNPVMQIKIAPKPIQSELKEDDDDSMKDPADPTQVSLELKPYATQEEIESGKLPPEEILSLPMFKNYTAGNPATVLYIKNLAKDVVVDDFYYIFGSFFGTVEVAKSSLSVKLMQEGRMRGQAFVTFPTVDIAHCALNLVNGYVFKGKPMIIQFGRNPASGKAN